MSADLKMKLSRRRWLTAASLLASGNLLHIDMVARMARHRFQENKRLGELNFVDESYLRMDKPLGEGLDGRLYTDLSDLTAKNSVTPVEKFYIRTRASQLLDSSKPWMIDVGGARKDTKLSLPELKKTARPMGLHLMECAGNTRDAHFGMLSVAEWTGAPVLEILASSKVELRAGRVLISGFDRYPVGSASSIAGASWIFTPEQLKSSNAFLATEMNGRPLLKDHGAPVRLVVPGWYGCTCIKWVNQIIVVEEDAAATSQMQEFASRTQQDNVPRLARDYRSALIEQAAMPIRVEKWLVGGKIKYIVAGILWGGSQRVKGLQIRFNPDEDYVRVDSFEHATNDPWSFWSHWWTPQEPGTYLIRLRVKDPPIQSRRLDTGYYVRAVRVTEV